MTRLRGLQRHPGVLRGSFGRAAPASSSIDSVSASHSVPSNMSVLSGPCLRDIGFLCWRGGGRFWRGAHGSDAADLILLLIDNTLLLLRRELTDAADGFFSVFLTAGTDKTDISAHVVPLPRSSLPAVRLFSSVSAVS